MIGLDVLWLSDDAVFLRVVTDKPVLNGSWTVSWSEIAGTYKGSAAPKIETFSFKRGVVSLDEPLILAPPEGSRMADWAEVTLSSEGRSFSEQANTIRPNVELERQRLAGVLSAPPREVPWKTDDRVAGAIERLTQATRIDSARLRREMLNMNAKQAMKRRLSVLERLSGWTR